MKRITKITAILSVFAALATVSCRKDENKPEKKQYEADIVI